MKITDVKVNLAAHQEPLKAFASITLDDCFVVHDLRIIKTADKMFVAMPSKKLPGGNFRKDIYKDIVHPINQHTRKMIEESVLSKYHSVIEKAQDHHEDNSVEEQKKQAE
ncbi:MAG: SpoVG family protein [Bdellovibrionales bacterium]|nr:SpoVG family protein [Bdellovibrionales bacterium]